MKKYILYILFCLSYFMPTYLFAGFPAGKGRTVLNFVGNTYYSQGIYDQGWHYNKSNPGDYFLSQYFSLYIAHGISRKFDLFASIPYVYEVAKTDSIVKTRSDFADAMLGGSYTISNKNFNKYTSFKAALILPLYSNFGKSIDMGYATKGVDLTINYVYRPLKPKHKGYYVFEGSYRKYFDLQDEGPKQLLFDVERCYLIRSFAYLTFGLNGAYSYSINKSSYTIATQNKDFTYLEAKISYGLRVRRNVTMYLSGFDTFAGRNAGAGYGGALSVVVKLP